MHGVKIMVNKKICLLLILLMGLSGCAGAVVGAGTTVALATAQERTFDDAVDDTFIKMKINGLWLDSDVKMFSNCSMTVSEGRVLLTGVVKTEEIMAKAVELTWQVDGVKEVINEIIVDPKGKTLIDISKDEWLILKIRANLTVQKDVQAINYSVDSVRGNIYLIGIAQNEQELDKVINIIRNTKSVASVVSYVRLKEIDDEY